MAIAVFTGLGQPAPQTPGWKAVVANYQVLYGKATLETANPSAEDTAQQVARVGNALGLNMSSLPEPAGLTFKRAQLLEFNGRTLVQIAYATDDGTPIALCILATQNPDTPDMDLAAIQGLGSASWNAAGFGYLLIGGDDSNALNNSANTFQTWSQSAT